MCEHPTFRIPFFILEWDISNVTSPSNLNFSKGYGSLSSYLALLFQSRKWGEAVKLTSSSLTSLRSSNLGLVGINLSQGLCPQLNLHLWLSVHFLTPLEGTSRKPALMLRHESALICFSSLEWPEVELNLQVEFKCPQMWRPVCWRGRKPGWLLYLWSFIVFQCKALIAKDFLPN